MWHLELVNRVGQSLCSTPFLLNEVSECQPTNFSQSIDEQS